MHPWFWSVPRRDLIGKTQNLIEIFFIETHESKALNKFKTPTHHFQGRGRNAWSNFKILRQTSNPQVQSNQRVYFNKMKSNTFKSSSWSNNKRSQVYVMHTYAYVWQASASTFHVEIFSYHSLYAYLFCCFSFYEFRLVVSVHFLLIPMHKTMKSNRIRIQVCVVCIWLNSIG